MLTTMQSYRAMLSAGIPADDIRSGQDRGDTLGEIAWSQGDRSAATLYDLDGWPTCVCTACECSDPAVTTDDNGCCVCAACEDYALDDDGEVICSQSERGADLERVTECCGAGGQTRTYMRLRPPVMPPQDEAGEWACYWATVGDDNDVVSRHSTYDMAAQAVAAHDWPPPGDHTSYLCGYEVRRLREDGTWDLVAEDER